MYRIFNSKNESDQSIIIFPGASPYAEEHPGMLMLGSSLRSAGYNVYLPRVPALKRSEERRVGKECRSRWSPYH